MMVFLEGLCKGDIVENWRDIGYMIMHVYRSNEEAMEKEPGCFCRDCGIGEDGNVWIRIYIDEDIEKIMGHLNG